MPRTILEIAQEAAERDATAPAPAVLFGTNNRIARILRTAAKDIIRDYLRSATWMGQSEFTSTWVFALQPGKFAYELPPDFLRMIPNTEHRGGWPLGLVGPANPVTWAQWIFGGQTTVAEMGWRIRNGIILFDPTPSTAELVTIEYISKYLVVSDVQAGDYDLTTKPPTVIAPLVPRDGHLSVPDYALFPSLSDDVFEFGNPPGWDVATWAENVSEALKALDPLSVLPPLPQVRRAEFTTDSDLPAFEDDYLLSLGMTAQLQRALSKPYVERMAEYEEEKEVRLASDGGHSKEFLVGADRPEVDVYPVANGRWLVS